MNKFGLAGVPPIGESVLPHGGRALWIVAACAVTLKALLLFVVMPLLASNSPMFRSDMFPDRYDMIAWNLATGQGYRVYADTSLTMLRTPGYVLMLAAVFALFGKSLLAAQALNFLISIATAGFVFALARRMSRSMLLACVAGLLVFLHPGTLIADSRGGPESMLMLFFALFLWLAERANRMKRYRDFVWLGLAFGAGMLIKSSVALILPGLACWVVFAHRRDSFVGKLFKGYALASLVAVLVLVPWVARNYSVSDHFVPTMTVGGLALFQGMYVVKSRESGKDHSDVLREAAQEQLRIARALNLPVREGLFPQFFSTTDEIHFYSELGRRALADYLNSPILIAEAVAFNLWAFWFQGRIGIATLVNYIVTVPMFLLVGMGLLEAMRKHIEVGPLLVVSVCYILPHAVIMSIPRYHIPLLPVLAILAAYPVTHFLEYVALKFKPTSHPAD